MINKFTALLIISIACFSFTTKTFAGECHVVGGDGYFSIFDGIPHHLGAADSASSPKEIASIRDEMIAAKICSAPSRLPSCEIQVFDGTYLLNFEGDEFRSFDTIKEAVRLRNELVAYKLCVAVNRR
jgi:hypothetical protein